MTKTKLYIALIMTFITSSCDKFLDVKPQDIKVVSTIEDYRDILASYMLLVNTVDANVQNVLGVPLSKGALPWFNSGALLAYYTGELTSNPADPFEYDKDKGMFKQNAVNKMTWNSPNAYAWDRYFTFLGPINLIINGIETAVGNNERMRDYVKGEALIWRAYSFYKLLQYYAPYKSDRLGVPLFLTPNEDVGNMMPHRATPLEVYKQIIADCEDALLLLKRTPTMSWNSAYNKEFIHAMLANMYLYKSNSGAKETTDLENAIKHANQAISNRKLVMRDDYQRMFNTSKKEKYKSDEFTVRIVQHINSDAFSFENIYYQSSAVPSALPSPSTELYAEYKADDIRTCFFTKSWTGVVYDKYCLKKISGYMKRGGVFMPFRLADTYLIKAEAHSRLGQMSEAKNTLDDFKTSRYIDVEASYTNSDLLSEILKERRLEFYHECDVWWIDMKRTEQRVERIINKRKYILEGNDYRYSFPIPQNSELGVNHNMEQNPGWENIKL